MLLIIISDVMSIIYIYIFIVIIYKILLKFFNSGWVQTVLLCNLDLNCILKAKVKASQRLIEKPHDTSVGVERKTGAIIIGHCTCMTG